jgi:hypothetical protein
MYQNARIRETHQLFFVAVNCNGLLLHFTIKKLINHQLALANDAAGHCFLVANRDLQNVACK